MLVYNGKSLGSIFYGTKEVIKVYHGTNIVYEKGGVPAYSTLYLTLTSDLTQTLVFNNKGTSGITIDWGDGSSEVFTDTEVQVSHTWASAGDKVVTVKVNDASETFTVGGDIGGDTADSLTVMNTAPMVNKKTDNTLTKFVFGKGALIPANGSFAQCTALTEVVMPVDWITIKAYCFQGCTALPSVDLSKVTQIEPYAFNGCTAITELTLPSTMSRVNTYAYQYCTALKTAEIGANTINSGAFKQCTALEKVWIRESCTQIDASTKTTGPFNQCTALKTIYVEADTKPAGFGSYFDYIDDTNRVAVVYGQKTKPW